MRISLAAGSLAAALAFNPAGGAPGERFQVVHEAPVPCHVLCGYFWYPDGSYNPCAEPFPEGSFDLTVFRFTEPRGHVDLSLDMEWEYDGFVCTNTSPRKLVGAMANLLTECRTHGVLGCTESTSLHYTSLLAANGGDRADEFVVLSFNWLDPGAATLTVTPSEPGLVEVLDDSYEASSELPSGP